MKPIITILSLILFFQINSLFASDVRYRLSAKEGPAHLSLEKLAPEPPTEADFSDSIQSPSVEKETQNIAPFVPKEATFEDNAQNNSSLPASLKIFKPTVPKEADFEK